MEGNENKLQERKEALERLNQLRSEMAAALPDDFDPETELIEALEEKYGKFEG